MTAAWDRDEALRVAGRLDEWRDELSFRPSRDKLRSASELLRAADAEIARLRTREADAERMSEALRGAVAIADPIARDDLRKQDRADRMADYPMTREYTPMMRIADIVSAAAAAWDASREGKA